MPDGYLFPDAAAVTKADNDAIRTFMEHHRRHIVGQTLDFGCGRQPYRDIVQAVGATYHPYDRAKFPDSHVKEDVGRDHPLALEWDTIVCNEVISLVDSPRSVLQAMHSGLQPGNGKLLLTYSQGWRQYNVLDRWRFTRGGMQWLLEKAGFEVLIHYPRWTVTIAPGWEIPMGYCAVAKAV